MSGDCMCEDYEAAKKNRESQAKRNDPYYWWQMDDPFDKKEAEVKKKPLTLEEWLKIKKKAAYHYC